MLDCLIIGDSIAKGLGDVRRDCTTIAKVGINTEHYVEAYSTKLPTSSIAIISLGSNDNPKVSDREQLWVLRERVDANYVIWVLPNEKLFPLAFAAIEDMAREFNDGTIKLHNNWLSHDSIHPTATGYKELAKSTKEVID
jgi:lysophospholipase L1-like esterase